MGIRLSQHNAFIRHNLFYQENGLWREEEAFTKGFWQTKRRRKKLMERQEEVKRRYPCWEKGRESHWNINVSGGVEKAKKILKNRLPQLPTITEADDAWNALSEAERKDIEQLSSVAGSVVTALNLHIKKLRDGREKMEKVVAQSLLTKVLGCKSNEYAWGCNIRVRCSHPAMSIRAAWVLAVSLHLTV